MKLLNGNNYLSIIVKPSKLILERAESFDKYNIKLKDALHLSCAIEAEANYFFTTDIALIKKSVNFKSIVIINPLRFIELLEV